VKARLNDRMRDPRLEEPLKPIHKFTCAEPGDILSVLSRGIPGASRSTLREYIAMGRVRVGGEGCKDFRRLVAAGCLVEVLRSSLAQAEGRPGSASGEKRGGIKGGLSILWEDAWLIAVEKPAGLLCAPIETAKTNTALDYVTSYLEACAPGARRRAALVHRLDRDTSGVMLFAKSAAAKKRMMDAWSDLVLERRYSALVEGAMGEREGRIDLPLAENRGMTMFVPIEGEGQPRGTGKALDALTEWKLVRENALYSLLDVGLETGRKNQIRAHLAHIGHPVAGDIKYGARMDPLGRLGLHALLLVFRHPFTGEKVSLESRIPPPFLAPFRSGS
jgi:23S rRNA pseudouridine1911/1915/1917 synthase